VDTVDRTESTPPVDDTTVSPPDLRPDLVFKHSPPVESLLRTSPQKIGHIFRYFRVSYILSFANITPPYMGVLFFDSTDQYSNKWAYCPQAEVVIHRLQALTHSPGIFPQNLSEQYPPNMDTRSDISDSRRFYCVNNHIFL